jgi:hypothetical protein
MHGWDPSSFVLTWVHDKSIVNISNCNTVVKELSSITGVMLAY